MKKSLCIILFILFAYSANAQWQQVYTVPGWVYTFTASGTNIFLGAASTGLHVSNNNGLNWSQGTLGVWVYSLAVSENYLFAGQSGNGIFRSSNNGANWVQTSLNNRFIRHIAVNGAVLMAATSSAHNEIYLSTNYGSNWSLVSSIPSEVHALARSGNYFFAGAPVSGVYISTNNGSNWQQSSLNDVSIRSLAANGSNLYAGTHSGVYISTNYGANWIETSLSTQNIMSVAVNGSNIYAANGTAGVYVSNNNGANWVQRNEGFGGLNVQNLFISGSYIYASAYTGSNHTVFRRPLSELTGITQAFGEIPLSFSLSQNYPNPFNPSTNFEFRIAQPGFVTLKVYNIRGQEIQTLVSGNLKAGVYKASFDAGSLPGGTYFYRLNTGNFIETKKMLLVK